MEDQQTKASDGNSRSGVDSDPKIPVLADQHRTSGRRDRLRADTPHHSWTRESPGKRGCPRRRNGERDRTAPDKPKSGVRTKLRRHSSRRLHRRKGMTPNPGMVQPNQPGNNQAGNQMPGGPGGRNGGHVSTRCESAGQWRDGIIPVRSSDHDAGERFDLYGERHAHRRTQRVSRYRCN